MPSFPSSSSLRSFLANFKYVSISVHAGPSCFDLIFAAFSRNSLSSSAFSGSLSSSAAIFASTPCPTIFSGLYKPDGFGKPLARIAKPPTGIIIGFTFGTADALVVFLLFKTTGSSIPADFLKWPVATMAGLTHPPKRAFAIFFLTFTSFSKPSANSVVSTLTASFFNSFTICSSVTCFPSGIGSRKNEPFVDTTANANNNATINFMLMIY